MDNYCLEVQFRRLQRHRGIGREKATSSLGTDEASPTADRTADSAVGSGYTGAADAAAAQSNSTAAVGTPACDGRIENGTGKTAAREAGRAVAGDAFRGGAARAASTESGANQDQASLLSSDCGSGSSSRSVSDKVIAQTRRESRTTLAGAAAYRVGGAAAVVAVVARKGKVSGSIGPVGLLRRF